MGLEDVNKAKVPAFPKEIDDKNLAGEYKKFEKAYADLQKASLDFSRQVGTASQTFGTIPYECLKKLKDKNLDPKQAKAYETLHKTVRDLENYVGKML